VRHMEHNESDVRQAEQLDRVVGNIISGDRDLFQGIQVSDVRRETLELIDLATFIVPPQDVLDSSFEQRMYAFAVRGSHQDVLQSADGGPDATSRAWSWLIKPVHGMGSAVAAFFAALFMEPMPGSRGTGSIDTPSRRWYKYQVGECGVGSARGSDEQVFCFGFSDDGSAYRAAVCR